MPGLSRLTRPSRDVLARPSAQIWWPDEVQIHPLTCEEHRNTALFYFFKNVVEGRRWLCPVKSGRGGPSPPRVTWEQRTSTEGGCEVRARARPAPSGVRVRPSARGLWNGPLGGLRPARPSHRLFLPLAVCAAASAPGWCPAARTLSHPLAPCPPHAPWGDALLAARAFSPPSTCPCVRLARTGPHLPPPQDRCPPPARVFARVSGAVGAPQRSPGSSGSLLTLVPWDLRGPCLLPPQAGPLPAESWSRTHTVSTWFLLPGR